jgi:hypothetical protein
MKECTACRQAERFRAPHGTFQAMDAAYERRQQRAEHASERIPARPSRLDPRRENVEVRSDAEKYIDLPF